MTLNELHNSNESEFSILLEKIISGLELNEDQRNLVKNLLDQTENRITQEIIEFLSHSSFDRIDFDSLN